MSNSFDNLQVRDAEFRQRLRQALGLSTGGDQMGQDDLYKLILKKRRISSILKEQMRNAGFEDLAKQTRIRRDTT